MNNLDLLNRYDAVKKLNKESMENFMENNIDEAERLSKSALKLAEEYQMENSYVYTDSLCILGDIYTARALYDDAAAVFNKALKIMGSNKVGFSAASYGTTMNKYGYVLMKSGKYRESIKPFKTACKYFLRDKEAKRDGYPVALLNLAYAYNETGRKILAELYLLKALLQRKKTQKVQPLAYAETLQAYAIFCEKNRKYQKAYHLYKEAAKIRFMSGDINDEYLQSLSGVAYTALLLEMNDEAIHIYKNIVSLCDEFDGGQGVRLGIDLTNLAFAYDAVRNFSKSNECYNKALDIFSQAGATETEDYATLLHNLGCSYQMRDQHARAIEYLEKALEIRKNLLGEKHPDYLFTLQRLAYSYAAAGDVDSADNIMAGFAGEFREARIRKMQAAVLIFLMLLILLVLAFRLGWL